MCKTLHISQILTLHEPLSNIATCSDEATRRQEWEMFRSDSPVKRSLPVWKGLDIRKDRLPDTTGEPRHGLDAGIHFVLPSHLARSK